MRHPCVMAVKMTLRVRHRQQHCVTGPGLCWCCAAVHDDYHNTAVQTHCLLRSHRLHTPSVRKELRTGWSGTRAAERLSASSSRPTNAWSIYSTSCTAVSKFTLPLSFPAAKVFVSLFALWPFGSFLSSDDDNPLWSQRHMPVDCQWRLSL